MASFFFFPSLLNCSPLTLLTELKYLLFQANRHFSLLFTLHIFKEPQTDMQEETEYATFPLINLLQKDYGQCSVSLLYKARSQQRKVQAGNILPEKTHLLLLFPQTHELTYSESHCKSPLSSAIFFSKDMLNTLSSSDTSLVLYACSVNIFAVSEYARPHASHSHVLQLTPADQVLFHSFNAVLKK